MLLAALSVSIALQGDAAIQLTPLASGASKKLGGYMPQRAAMAEQAPAAIRKSPEGLAAPRYGVLPIGAGSGLCFILDEPEGAPAKLYVDANGNADLTDDPAPQWEPKESKGSDGNTYTMYQGGAMVDIGDPGQPLLVHVSMYRFDKADPKRAEIKNTLLYYRDYAYEGEIELGGKRFAAMLVDELARGDFRGKPVAEEDRKKGSGSGVALLLDVNANGKFDVRGEKFDVLEPFNIGGTTWEIAAMARTGASFRIEKSKRSVAEIPPPPDHSVGAVITPFEAVDTDGKAVAFPRDFKGKVVLLDFWATWCPPCMEEMPNVVAAHGKFHGQGFEVLGVSLDNDKSIARMPEVMKKTGMTWRQVADGKGWGAALAQLYVVNSIPATFLVDGTSGKILGVNLRGADLAAAIEKALAGSRQ